jgi:hypothetical protein
VDRAKAIVEVAAVIGVDRPLATPELVLVVLAIDAEAGDCIDGNIEPSAAERG